MAPSYIRFSVYTKLEMLSAIPMRQIRIGDDKSVFFIFYNFHIIIQRLHYFRLT